MSEDYHIGLSRAQIEKLLRGGAVGKRPYYEVCASECGNVRYRQIRIYVRMLTEKERRKEPDTAFSWE